MLKVLAAVLSVLSAIISISIYTATLPAVQKQAADNAAAIEQNAESIEQIQSAIENIPTEEKKLYLHSIYFKYNDTVVRVNYYSSKSSYSSFANFYSDLTTNTYIMCDSTIWRAFKKQSDTHITYLYINQGVLTESSYNSITNISSFSDSTIRVL